MPNFALVDVPPAQKLRGRPFAKGDDPRRRQGRPPLGKALTDILRQHLEIPLPELWELATGQTRRVLTVKEALVIRKLCQALMGNERSEEYLWDRLEGRPMQAMEVDDKREAPYIEELRRIRADMKNGAKPGDGHG